MGLPILLRIPEIDYQEVVPVSNGLCFHLCMTDDLVCFILGISSCLQPDEMVISSAKKSVFSNKAHFHVLFLLMSY